MFRATKIRGYMKAMRERGISEKKLLAGTAIDAARAADPNYLITLDQYHAVVANMMALTGDPGVAFSLRDIVDVNELGIVGYAMLSAGTLREATRVWFEYSNSLVGAPTSFESFHDVESGYELRFSTAAATSALHRFETEEILVQGFKLVQDLTGVKPVLRQVSLAYPKPNHVGLYKSAFSCALQFDAPRTVVRVQRPGLDAPIKTGNEELFRIHSMHCQDIMRSIPGSGPLHSRLRGIFLATPGNLPDKKEVSAMLGISVSTLTRQLEQQGFSYQEVKDQFRFDLAREFLRSGHMAQKQVGHLVGFTTASAFSRAFKTWSGVSVGHFLKDIQKQHRG